MQQQPSFHLATAIIPAYNEAATIASLLDVLIQVSHFSEIIVVDDHSTDATREIVRGYCLRDERIRLVCLPVNLGKGGALAAGADESNNDLVVFLDADLVALQPAHILDLMEPLQSGACEMTLGIFKGGRFQTDWSHRLMPFLSGQRCLKWSLFKYTPGFSDARWGAEVAMSLYARQNRLKVRHVTWRGVTHVMRPEKNKGVMKFWSHVQMWWDIGLYLIQRLNSQRKSDSRKSSRTSTL
jgi:hypothetical protein